PHPETAAGVQSEEDYIVRAEPVSRRKVLNVEMVPPKSQTRKPDWFAVANPQSAIAGLDHVGDAIAFQPVGGGEPSPTTLFPSVQASSAADPHAPAIVTQETEEEVVHGGAGRKLSFEAQARSVECRATEDAAGRAHPQPVFEIQVDSN